MFIRTLGSVHFVVFSPLFFSSRGARGHAGSSVSVLVVKNPYDLRSQSVFGFSPKHAPLEGCTMGKKKQQQKVEETRERKKERARDQF